MRKSIKLAILIPSIIVLLIGIAVEISVIAFKSSKTVTHLSDELVLETVSHYVFQFKSTGENSFGAVMAIQPVIASFSNGAGTREQVIDILSEALHSNKDIFGMWTCWEPNAFDGEDANYVNKQYHDETGRFIPYVYQTGTETRIEALRGYTDAIEGKYYLDALNSGKLTITDPFFYNIDGRDIMMYSIAIPVLDKNNKVIGVVGADIDMTSLSETMGAADILEDGYLFVLSPSGLITTHPNKNYLLKSYNDLWLKQFDGKFKALQKEWGEFSEVALSGELNKKVTLSAESVAIGDSGDRWIICAIIPQETVAAPVINTVTTTIIVAVLLVLAVSITIFIIVSRKTKPIVELEKTAREIANGNLNVNLRAKSEDEIGMLITSFAKVRDTILQLTNEIHGVTTSLEQGDIDARIPDDNFNGEYKETVHAINAIVDAYIKEILTILDAYGEFGNGNFNGKLDQFPGKKALANIKFNALQSNLQSVNEDVSKLINAAIKGNLEMRVSTDQYSGDWYKLTTGLNNLLQAVNTPIEEANAILKQLSEGNFNVAVNKNLNGSFADMMHSFDKMVESVGSYINEITDILGNLASGDLTRTISRQYVGQFDLIKDSINHIAKTLKGTISEIKTSADSVLMGAGQISETSMDLANGASTQSCSVQELNALITTVNQQTLQTVSKAKLANDFSHESIKSAKVGNDDILRMLHSMDEVKEASKNISKIIKVIDDIAFQTNLLALNAAVEAARAGEHGKGFAVVAQEVRSLAARSQNAARDTSLLIEDTISKINGGTETAKITADALQKIISGINTVADIINQIYVATDGQTEGISKITYGINKISEVVQNNVSTSEEAAAAAEELNSQSEVLAQMVARFRL